MADRVWGSIRDLDHVHVRVTAIPEACRGALVRRADGSVWVFIDETLGPEERRATLLHELVHLERGSARWAEGQPATWDAVVAREENRVDDIVADRLVPDAELEAFVRRCLTLDMSVTAEDVADEFGVPVEIAERACRRAS